MTVPRRHDRGETREAAAGSSARIVLLSYWLLPLAVWPGLARPFAIPKLWVLAGATALLLAAVVRTRRDPLATPGHACPRRRLLVVVTTAWIGGFVLAAALGPLPSLPDVALGILAPAFAWGVVCTGIEPRRVVRTQVAAATAVAGIALLQWAGADPLAWLGWQAPVDGLSVRMRVHATLGNPNFVGALMALTLPLAGALLVDVPSRGRWHSAVVVLALVCLMGALVATGSRGAVLGLAAGSLVFTLLRGARRALVIVSAVVIVGTLAVLGSPGRPLQTTLAGRLYLWQVVAPHAAAHPVTGYGPGAVALRFPSWQRQADARGVSDPRFRGLTDHVHNDYLEALVERGVIGLGTVLLPIGVVMVVAWRRRPCPPLLAGLAASVAAGAACAFVDFPLARPVELVWWWTAVGLVHMVGHPASRADA